MKRTVWLWELFGFATTSLAGTLLHFLYDWLGNAIWIAPFSGVNESTWEHMKLLFWPMLIYALIQSFFFKEYGNFWSAKLRGILIGLISIPIMFYTYNGVIGKSPDWINIAIFFIAAAFTYFYQTKELYKEIPSSNSKKADVFALCLIALLFVIFTFSPPNLNIFKDPITGNYGIPMKS